jgi:hypothetical protein
MSLEENVLLTCAKGDHQAREGQKGSLRNHPHKFLMATEVTIGATDHGVSNEVLFLNSNSQSRLEK